MIDHFTLKVKSLEVSKAFYQATLTPLNYHLQFDTGQVVSFTEPRDADPGGDFWLNVGQQEPMHFAFSAQTCQEVDAFYQQLWLLEERIMVHLASVKITMWDTMRPL